MMCVNDAFGWPVSVRWLLMTRRFSSRTLTGMLRMEVAVGIGQRGLHVLGDLAGRAAKRDGGVVGRDGGAGAARAPDVGCGAAGCGAGAATRLRAAGSGDRHLRLFFELFLEARLVIVKELLPARAHRFGIGAVALVKLFDECDVGAVGLRDG